MTTLALLLALAVALATVIILMSLFYYALFYVPYVPTPINVAKMMVDAAQIKDQQIVIDLGCGDGRLLGYALLQHDITAIGYEVNWMARILATFRFLKSAQKPLIKNQNFFSADLSQADVVFCYLFPKTMKRLREKFEKELKPGAVIVSYSFPLEGWEPEKILQTDPKKPKNFLIYRYRKA